MKTLKELAAEHNLYQAQDVPKKYRSESFKPRLGVVRDASIPEFLEKCDLIEIGRFYECRTDKNATDKKESHYIETSHIILKSKSNDNLLMLAGNDYQHKGKYYFRLYHKVYWKYYGIDRHKLAKVIDAIAKPNLIGVFTDKKVKEWLDYCDHYLKESEALLADVTGENLEIEKQIQAIKDSLPHAKVSEYNGNIWLYTDLFEIQLTHYKASCYLEKKVKFQGKVEDVIRIETAISK